MQSPNAVDGVVGFDMPALIVAAQRRANSMATAMASRSVPPTSAPLQAGDV